METRLCVYCEMPFTPIRGTQVCCCKEHSIEYTRLRKKFNSRRYEERNKEKRRAARQQQRERTRRNGAIIKENSHKMSEEERRWIGKPKAAVFNDPKVDIALEKEAAALGMSYGEIQSHRYIGDLAKVIEQKKQGLHGDVIYKSWIGAGGKGGKGPKI